MRRAWLLLAIAACDNAGSTSEPSTAVKEVAVFPAVPVNKLDMLFQIDNSASTADIQTALGLGTAALFETLAADGGLPDLHVGVITSDLGTSGSKDPANPGPGIGQVGQGGCAGQGDDGQLVTNGTTTQGTFLVDEAGPSGRVRNYDGRLADVVYSMIALGDHGCGFEQPLAATRRAVQRDSGFLRDDASLAIVILADEDDCSIADATLLDSGAPLGPLQSFRCTRYGLICDQPLDEVGAKTGCRPWSESPYVEDPQLTATALFEKKALERLVVAAIVGGPDDIEVELRSVGGAAPSPMLAHGCRWNDGNGEAAADPALRIGAFLDPFASRGIRASVCTTDQRPALRTIGMAIKRSLGTACIDTSQLSDALSADGIQPACEAFDVVSGVATALPRCPADGDCFDIVEDAARCPETADHARIDVTRTAAPAPGTRVEVRCEATP